MGRDDGPQFAGNLVKMLVAGARRGKTERRVHHCLHGRVPRRIRRMMLLAGCKLKLVI